MKFLRAGAVVLLLSLIAVAACAAPAVEALYEGALTENKALAMANASLEAEMDALVASQEEALAAVYLETGTALEAAGAAAAEAEAALQDALLEQIARAVQAGRAAYIELVELRGSEAAEAIAARLGVTADLVRQAATHLIPALE